MKDAQRTRLALIDTSLSEVLHNLDEAITDLWQMASTRLYKTSLKLVSISASLVRAHGAIQVSARVTRRVKRDRHFHRSSSLSTRFQQ